MYRLRTQGDANASHGIKNLYNKGKVSYSRDNKRTMNYLLNECIEAYGKADYDKLAELFEQTNFETFEDFEEAIIESKDNG